MVADPAPNVSFILDALRESDPMTDEWVMTPTEAEIFLEAYVVTRIRENLIWNKEYWELLKKEIPTRKVEV